MDFQAVLNCKPFVPSNPPSPPLPPSSPPPGLEPIQEVPEGETESPSETQGRKRRRRRNNAAKRKQSAVEKDASQSSLPTPPSSNPHTPLRTGFSVSPLLPQVIQEQKTQFNPDQVIASMVTRQSEAQLEGPPTLRLLEATPVLPPFPTQEPMEDLPIEILQAIASRARDRLATRIQMGWDEQQQAIAAAMRIQEAYSMHIEAQLEKAVRDLKWHVEKEMDKRLAKYEEKWRKEMESSIKEATKPPKKKKKNSSVMDDEEMSTVVAQLHAHCKQICTVFSGLQVSQLETVESVREVRVILESLGLLVPRYLPVVLPPAPAPGFGGMPPNVHPAVPQPFGNGSVNMPAFLVNNNARIPPLPNLPSHVTAKATNAKVKPAPKADASGISKLVFVEGNQGSTPQPNHAKVGKENEVTGLQPPTTEVAKGRTDSLRL